MTDTDHHDADDQADGPDTFDDRLAGIARLIDTFVFDPDDDHRRLRRVVIVRLLGELLDDSARRVLAELSRAVRL